tara:strand:- start:114 stop:359 length:246 start_codon:yes stop_codon:yes gene_type:complete
LLTLSLCLDTGLLFWESATAPFLSELEEGDETLVQLEREKVVGCLALCREEVGIEGDGAWRGEEADATTLVTSAELNEREE